MIQYWIYHYLDRYIGIPVCLLISFVDKLLFLKRNNPTNFDNILIIKLAMVGDTILLVPALRALREKYPLSHITMMCSPINKVIVENWNFIDEYFVFNFAKCFKHPWEFIKLMIELRKRKFDVTLDFETWPRIIPLVAYLTGAGVRVGFNVPGQMRHFLFTHPVEHIRKKHEVKCFIDVVNAVGVEVEDISIDIEIREDETKKIEKILQENGIQDGMAFVIIHPGAGIHGYYRQWFEDRYAEVADYVIEKYGLKVVITGSRDDGKIVQDVISSMKNKPVNISMKTTLKELFALVKKASLVVCGNTGILHIASAVGTPVIALHGPTDVDKWGPLGKGNIIVRKDLPCSPCSYLGFEYSCKRRTCMELITVEEIKQSVDRKIADSFDTVYSK